MLQKILTSEQTFSLIPGRRKYLLLADSSGFQEIFPILDKLIENEWSFELHFIGKSETLSCRYIEDWLSRQKIGTYLYISAKWETVGQLIKIATRAGFTEEEMQAKGFGKRVKRVFCARCYAINPVVTAELEIVCKQCGQKLEVSTHYSRLHDAYYGFVTIT